MDSVGGPSFLKDKAAAQASIGAPACGSRRLASLTRPGAVARGRRDAYHGLFRHIRAAVDPKDAIEEFWVRDVVDLLWETLRLRRLKAALMRAVAHEGPARVLTPLVPNMADRNELVRAWASKDREAERQVAQLLKSANLDEAAITRRAGPVAL